MDPLLLIIKYLFEKKNITNDDESIDSFFANGISFPKFIQLIFNVDSIPGVRKNPKMVFHKKINNDTALQYLFYRNEKIKKINPSYETEKNQINLLQLILTLQCFPANIEEIIDRSNKILEKSGVHITKKNELINLKILTSLLNIFTKGSFPISDNYNEIITNFQKSQIPQVFNEKSLDVQNSYIFIIQIQIILDFFSEIQNQSLLTENKDQGPPPTQQKVLNDQPKISNTYSSTQINNQSEQQKPPILYNETSTPSNVTENKSFSIRDRIKFYNQNVANNNEVNKPSAIEQNRPFQSNLPETQMKMDDQISEPSILESQKSDNETSSENLRIIDEASSEITEHFGLEDNDIDNEEEDQDQEADYTSEDTEQIEKEFEAFQNFISAFSDTDDDKIEEDINEEEETCINAEGLEEDINKVDQNEIEEEEEEEEEEGGDAEPQQIISFNKVAKNLTKLNSGILNFISNLKNYINIGTVYERLHVDHSTSPEKLWNIKINNYNYDNGIIYCEKELNNQSKKETKDDKSKKDDKNKKDDKSKKDDNNKKEDINNNDVNENRIPKSNLYKIMRYDEKKECWHFCESDFEKVVSNKSINPIIPLVLFVDSNMEDINTLSSVIRKDDLKNIPEKEISVLSFWKDSPNFMGSEPKSECIDNIREPLFLYVYIPKEKEKYKNIGSILIQIYTFLFLICDLTVVLMNEKYQNMQIMILNEIIQISDLYLKSPKNEKNIFLSKSKLLFLNMNKKNKEEMTKNIKSCIKKPYELKHIQNIKSFLVILDDIAFVKCYTYSDITATLNQVNSLFSQISSLYLYLRKEKEIHKILKELLSKRYNIIKEEQKNLGNDNANLEILKEESYKYFPKNDPNVSRVCNIIIFDMSIEYNQVDNQSIITKLNEKSQVNLKYLQKKINEKKYWDIKQIIIIIQSHMRYLEEEYFEILKGLGESTILDVLYVQNLKVLEAQKTKDDTELKKIFTIFIKNINKKQSVVDESFNKSSKKGTNYVMKEVQSIREIEVICEKGGDIDTLIEPDF
ncbi:hypothetical protein M9Y10_008826 [Tritrichomonas musculus]|uniref:Uncharacterized protein n=1 Tax=Tritrichomonas musculus TaxID=1915356 RepID=A0ABR2IZ34_9EUKA